VQGEVFEFSLFSLLMVVTMIYYTVIY